MHEDYTRSRYPFVLNEEVVSPAGYVNREKAAKALVVKIAQQYLRDMGIEV